MKIEAELCCSGENTFWVVFRDGVIVNAGNQLFVESAIDQMRVAILKAYHEEVKSNGTRLVGESPE